MSDLPAVIERLLAATNAHDIDALVGCFSPDYVNVTPAHPVRGFTGQDQVRRNWTGIFGGVPDLTARVLATAVDGSTTWTEWEMRGTRRDGVPHVMAGVIVFETGGDHIRAARFFLEPVEVASGDVDAAVERATGAGRP